QRFQVDLELFSDLQKAGQTDDMTDSIHYGQAYERVQRIVEGKAKKLIEFVAEDIAMDLLQAFAGLEACSVRLFKPDARIPGKLDYVAVEINREKCQWKLLIFNL